MKQFYASVLFACALVCAGAFLASDHADATPPLDLASGMAATAVNTRPVPNVLGSNSLPAPQVLSTDPQIGWAVTGSTGATAATTSFTVMKADTTFTPLRGAIDASSTNGTFTLARSGLYRFEMQGNCAAANGETSTMEIATTTDDTNYTTCTTASFVALTGALTQGVHGVCYFTETSAAAALSAGASATHVVVRGKNSAGTTTCKSMTLLSVERVDTLQPAVYP